MSRIKMYKDVLDDIRALADSLGALVAAMESDEGEKTEPVKKEKKAEPEKAPEKKITLEEVRQALTAKSGEGHTAEVKALFAVKSAYFQAEISIDTADSNFSLTSLLKLEDDQVQVVARRFGGPG